ncbi:MAG: polysaccharide pyruvyl transferase family protein [Actinomycetota bacterium]
MTGLPPTAQLLVADDGARNLEKAQAVLFMLGGYDGSGNYGDIAQFLAALALVRSADERLVAVPVIEREHMPKHAQLLGGQPGLDGAVLAQFDPGLEVLPTGLRPLALPSGTAAAGAYLYGGGFLNPSWGDRKLAHLHAMQRAVGAAGLELSVLLGSGLQVDSDWVSRLAPADAGLLAGFKSLGVRDLGSMAAVAELLRDGRRAPEAPLTGDDAVGFLAQYVAGPPPFSTEWPPTAGFRINVHLNDHEWVTDDPEGLMVFVATFLEELAQVARQPIVVQPIMGYEDPRISERPGIDRFAALCRQKGLGIEEAILLRPASMNACVPVLRQAALTVSCSYHIALTSLLLGVPTAIVVGNPYYRQKAAGLQSDFSLPDTLLLEPRSSPGAAARRAFDDLSDAEGRAALDAAQHAGALRVVARRQETEEHLAQLLSEAVEAGIGPGIETLQRRLQRGSVAAAELMHELAILRVERQALVRVAEDQRARLAQLEQALIEQRTTVARHSAPAPPETQLAALERHIRVVEGELEERTRALGLVLSSLSWKLTRPLRTLKSVLRRRT